MNFAKHPYVLTNSTIAIVSALSASVVFKICVSNIVTVLLPAIVLVAIVPLLEKDVQIVVSDLQLHPLDCILELLHIPCLFEYVVC